MSDGSISAVAPNNNIWENKQFIGQGFTVKPEANIIRDDKFEPITADFSGKKNDADFHAMLKKEGLSDADIALFKETGRLTLFVNKDTLKEINDLKSKGYEVNFNLNGVIGGYAK